MSGNTVTCPMCQATDNREYVAPSGAKLRACGRCMLSWQDPIVTGGKMTAREFALGKMPRGHDHYSYAVLEVGVGVYVECGADREKAETIVNALNHSSQMSGIAQRSAEKIATVFKKELESVGVGFNPNANALKSIIAIIEQESERNGK